MAGPAEMLLALALSVQTDVVRHRRWLHQHPELRWETPQTREHILQHVQATDPAEGITVEVLDDFTGGIVVDVTFDYLPTDTPRIIFRADFDALPIQESTELSFASKNDGVMHACGHDAHTAMLLGAFKLIVSGQVKPSANLRFVFQDAEENPGTEPRAESGGEVLVREGVLGGISEAYGLHIWSTPGEGVGTPGVFYSRAGGILGNSGRMKVVLTGGGGHVARPHEGLNMKWVTNAIQFHLDTFVARHINPFHPATLQVVVEDSGTASNVLAEDATIWIAFRTNRPRTEHAELMDLIEHEIKTILQLYPGAEIVEVQKIHGHPATINTPGHFTEVKDLLESAGQNLAEHPGSLGGEDFAWYLEGTGGVPGGFWFLGAYTPGTKGHHWSSFNPDEDVLYLGVLYWLLLATK